MNKQALLKHYRLTPEEYQLICQHLKSSPSRLELALFSALWSEHCSYKSSVLHLKKLFFRSPKVVSARGENAGVVDLGQGEKVAFKIESHNHPSQITPTHGASTGVGGILRDVFIMNARPLALANYLCFGTPSSTQTADLLDGVVRGIGGYGNSMGIATLTGQTEFHPSYNKNILVNAFALGFFGPKDKIISSKAKGKGHLLVYVGARTGRDGIHGASMASESFMKQKTKAFKELKEDSQQEKNKASVQIGDPFYGKLLMESCLEVFKKDLVVAGQDMGAAGLISSSFEMISKGQMGMKMHLDKVPIRDSTMTPEEILLSESQERALLVVRPEKYNEVKQVFKKWGLLAQSIGELTQKKEVELFWHKKSLVRIDPTLLTEKAPRYNRPYRPWRAFCRVSNKEEIDRVSHNILSAFPPSLKKKENTKNVMEVLLSLLKDIRGTNRRFIYQQYDQRVGARTLKDSSFPLGVIRLPHSQRALAIRIGGRPYIMRMDSLEGGKDSVYEPALQLAIRGFKPLALTDGLNFGSPENPKVMSEFVACVQGMAKASRALKTPVVSGNVSFYNETAGKSITPTPATVMIGLSQVAPVSGEDTVDAEPISDRDALPNRQVAPVSGEDTVDAEPISDRDALPNTPLVCLISAHQLFCKGLISEVAHQNPAFYGSLQKQISCDFIHKILKATALSPPLAVRMVGKFGLLYTLSRLHLGMKIHTHYDPFQERLYEFLALLKPESIPVWQSVFFNTPPHNDQNLFTQKKQTLSLSPIKPKPQNPHKKKTTSPYHHSVFKIEKIGSVIKEPVLEFNNECIKMEQVKKAYESGWNKAFKNTSAEHISQV